MLTHVQTLWELMLLGEPLVVLAPSPDVSSELVLALTRYKLYLLDCRGCAWLPSRLHSLLPTPQLPTAPEVLL